MNDDLAHPEPQLDPADLFEPRVLDAARRFYDPALVYHHFGHALRAVGAGERLLAVCATAGVPVAADVVRLALLFHDAGFGTDPTTAGFTSDEAYAAALARRVLSGSEREPVLSGVESAILATRRDAVPATVEGRVVRAADLAELAADFDTYRANSDALRAEMQQLTGAFVPADQWRACCAAVVGGYLDEPLWPISLPGAIDDPRGFHATTRSNLDRYLTQLADT